MKTLIALITLLSLLTAFSATAQKRDCYDDFLTKNVDSGKFLFTGNGWVFETMAGDNIDAMLWLPTSSLLICSNPPFRYEGKTYDVWLIINTDDGEKVEAFRIK